MKKICRNCRHFKLIKHNLGRGHGICNYFDSVLMPHWAKGKNKMILENRGADCECFEEKMASCPTCKKPRGEDKLGAYVCPCPHCGCELPF